MIIALTVSLEGKEVQSCRQRESIGEREDSTVLIDWKNWFGLHVQYVLTSVAFFNDWL
jgi:hypothetical protein